MSAEDPSSSFIDSWLSSPLRFLLDAPAYAETLLEGFNGGTGDLSPADIGGAVGTLDVVSSLNGIYYFYTKSGTLITSVTGQSFWCSGSLAGCPGVMEDPRIVYDFYSNRWVVSALPGGGPAATLTWVGVSQTSDPTGAWNLYSIASCGQAFVSPTEQGDQPHLGLNSQWIVVKDASCHHGDNGETALHVFDKNQLYSGNPLQLGVNQFDFKDIYDVDAPVLTFAPSTINNREYLAVSNQTPSGSIQVIYSHLEGPVDAPVYASTTQSVTLSLNGNNFVPPGFQIGCSTPCIGFGDDGRINSASVSNGKNGHTYIAVSFAVGEPFSNPNTSYLALVATDTSNGQATSLAVTSTSPTVAGYPSIALANGTNQAIVGYARFRPTEDPLGRAIQWDIGTNTTTGVNTVVTSPATYGSTRWGDYSTTVLDPSDSTVIWTAQDYSPNQNDQDSWWEKIAY